MSLVPGTSPPDFLAAQHGDLVVVAEGQVDWWLGYVIHIVGGARNPNDNGLFQIADIDTGKIKIVNADLVKAILRRKA